MHGHDRRSSVNPLTLALESAPFPPQARIFLELLLCQTRLFALNSVNCPRPDSTRSPRISGPHEKRVTAT